MTMPHDDTDWLCPDATPASVPPPATAMPGVFRCDAEGEESVHYRTLIEATAEPPMSPEARIICYVAGSAIPEMPVLLAEATRDDARRAWTISILGSIRLHNEAHGQAAE